MRDYAHGQKPGGRSLGLLCFRTVTGGPAGSGECSAHQAGGFANIKPVNLSWLSIRGTKDRALTAEGENTHPNTVTVNTLLFPFPFLCT